MLRARHHFRWLASASMLLLVAGSVFNLNTSRCAASSKRFVVIVHPSNPITEISKSQLSLMYLRKVTRWEPNGAFVKPADLPYEDPTRDAFTHEILNRTCTAQRNYWRHRVFSGLGVPPVVLPSSAALLQYVLRHPGAVGYLPIGAPTGGAKIVVVR